MTAFKALFISNLKRRLIDGFAVGYNLMFPLLMIFLLGFLCKGMYRDQIITSYQYYGIVIIPFCMFLSVITAAYAGKDDAYANTANRILVAPVSNAAIVFSKIFAEIIVFTGCSFIVLVLSVCLFDVCDIKYIVHILILYIVIAFLSASVGTYFGLGMKDFMKFKNILSIPVLIFAIFGGCFYQFGTLNKILSLVMNLSPLRWINKSLFLLIYDKNSTVLYILNLIMLIVGCVFTLLAIISFKREEYGNGELPGYEK